MKKLIVLLLLLPSIALCEIVTVDGVTCYLKRDKRKRIVRSHTMENEFKRANLCPATGKIEKSCKGFVVDHIRPLCACGVDDPSNMQYQSLAESKIKDKWERKLCGGD